MSKPLRIALVAEGPTDYSLIEAALKAILSQSFVLDQLQPEATQPQLGSGWCGVLNWCHQLAQRHHGPLLADPLFQINPYDLLIIHLDVDVALKHYSNCGTRTETWAQTQPWQPLPCNQPCPPASNTVIALETVLISWLGPVTLDPKTLLCLPAQSSGTWLAAACLPATHPLLDQAECNPSLEAQLAQLPKKERIKKNKREYQARAQTLTDRWQQVKAHCPQAQTFEQAVRSKIP